MPSSLKLKFSLDPGDENKIKFELRNDAPDASNLFNILKPWRGGVGEWGGWMREGRGGGGGVGRWGRGRTLIQMKNPPPAILPNLFVPLQQ